MGAGISIKELLDIIVQKGFLFQYPRHKNVTIGGAVSSDVHGKNHHVDGSFGNFIKRIKILDNEGKIKNLFPKDKDDFWINIGAMGLTGVILEVDLYLIKIESAYVKVHTSRFDSIENLMEQMIQMDEKFKYSVAWIDSLHNKFRGVLTCGEHAKIFELDNRLKEEPLRFNSSSLANTPNIFGLGILNEFTIRAFNEAWFRKASKHNLLLYKI